MKNTYSFDDFVKDEHDGNKGINKPKQSTINKILDFSKSFEVIGKGKFKVEVILN